MNDGEKNADKGGPQKEQQAANAAAEASKRDHLDGEKAKHGWHGVRGVYEKHRVAGF